MDRKRLIKTGAAVGLVSLWAATGVAQVYGPPTQKAVTAPIQNDGATTVSPLIVRPLAPPPKVGSGAPYFTPEELTATHDTVVREERVTRFGLEDMRPPPGQPGHHTPKQEKFSGDFSLEALCDTANADQLALINTSEAAAKATQDALDARAAGDKASAQTVEATELARQAAVRAYMAARATAQEADFRVDDFRNLPRLNEIPADALPSEVERRTLERKANGGVIGASEYADLSIVSVVADSQSRANGVVLKVTGRINNPRNRPIADPPLTISLLDKGGFTLSSRDFRPPASLRIPAGRSVAFSYDVPDPSPYAETAAVTFASSRRLSQASLQGCQVRPR